MASWHLKDVSYTECAAVYLIVTVSVLPLWDTTVAATNKPPFAHKAFLFIICSPLLT